MSNKIEKKLFENMDLDSIIEEKILNDIQNERILSKKSLKRLVETDFKNVPGEKIFSADVTYLVFNRITKRESYINGKAIDGLIGLNQDIRRALENKTRDSFSVDGYFVKFNNFIHHGKAD
jgi:hypothetical protein